MTFSTDLMVKLVMDPIPKREYLIEEDLQMHNLILRHFCFF